jgi:hypothetical protein
MEKSAFLLLAPSVLSLPINKIVLMAQNGQNGNDGIEEMIGIGIFAVNEINWPIFYGSRIWKIFRKKLALKYD